MMLFETELFPLTNSFGELSAMYTFQKKFPVLKILPVWYDVVLMHHIILNGLGPLLNISGFATKSKPLCSLNLATLKVIINRKISKTT